MMLLQLFKRKISENDIKKQKEILDKTTDLFETSTIGSKEFQFYLAQYKMELEIYNNLVYKYKRQNGIK